MIRHVEHEYQNGDPIGVTIERVKLAKGWFFFFAFICPSEPAILQMDLVKLAHKPQGQPSSD
jgi:hypothetical protein